MEAKSAKETRYALITGATSGIGKAVAERLGCAGYDVGILAENPALVQETASELRTQRICAFPFPADLSKPEQVRGLIDRFEAEIGPLEVLVNNAGIGLQAATLEIREEDMRLLFEVNFFAMVTLSRDAFRHMAARRHGHILNVSSCAARRGLPGMSLYASTKAAMHAFSQALRVDGRVAGVHVTEILPMSVHTPFFENARNRSGKPYAGSGYLSVTPERVAELIEKALHRPRPEIYTSRLARFALALDGFTPGLLDAILTSQQKKTGS